MLSTDASSLCAILTQLVVERMRKVNMAGAIHQGKTDRMECRFKDHEARNWKHFEAWKVLKGHRKFLPPNQPRVSEVAAATAAAAASNAEDDSAGDDTNGSEGDDSPAADRALLSTPRSNGSSNGNNGNQGSTDTGTSTATVNQKPLRILNQLGKFQHPP